MDDKQFEAIIEIKIEELVSLLMEKKEFDFENALNYLYISKLYNALITEHTKLWHLSALKLEDMLETENRTNELVYPDYV